MGYVGTWYLHYDVCWMNKWMEIHMKAGVHIYKIAKEQEYAFFAWLWHESI